MHLHIDSAKIKLYFEFSLIIKYIFLYFKLYKNKRDKRGRFTEVDKEGIILNLNFPSIKKVLLYLLIVIVFLFGLQSVNGKFQKKFLVL